jgi:hypothetical protein
MFKKQAPKQFARDEFDNTGAIRRVASANLKTAAKAVTLGVGLVAAGAANAAISTTEVTTAITDASAAIAVIGAAVLVLIVGIKVWKWMGRAL